jgi:hypothetical protein
MNQSDNLKRIPVREAIQSEFKASIEDKVSRYLEVDHQLMIGAHYFSAASTECIYLYRDGYFIAAVMMSHAINEGIIKFVADRNNIERHNKNGETKSVDELIQILKESKLISETCANASKKIWKSFRADIHHMNPTVTEIPFQKLASQNLQNLSTIERELFGFDYGKQGGIIPRQPKYWDIDADGKTSVNIRFA